MLAGPTGTGKELVARAIHQLSPVSQQRLAVCNCSAMVDTLLESQLFGHMRGAFTGATEMRPGLFEYANGGTVFLDEVGETSLAMQAKLLRVIQNREVQRVGSPEVRHVNVRLIAATNRDLRAEVLAGRFREDLFYRLSSIQIRIPSLMERLEDIPLLVQFFLKKYNQAYTKNISGLTRRAQTVLLQHAWPGNVRELENVVSSAAITTTGDFIDLCDLPENLQHRGQRSTGRAGVAAAVAGRGAESAYPAGVTDVHGEPVAGGAGVGDRTDQFVPLFETGPGGDCGADQTARGSGGVAAELKIEDRGKRRRWSSCRQQRTVFEFVAEFTATSLLLLTLLIA